MPFGRDVVAVVAPQLTELSYVQAVGIGGSWGRGTATVLSDIDIFVLIEAADLRRFRNNLAAMVRQNFSLILTLDRGFVPQSGYLQQFVFDDASMLDVSAITEEALDFAVQPDMLVAFDRNGRLGELMRSARRFDDLDEGQRTQYIEQFRGQTVVFSLLAATAIRKRDPWLALYELERARNSLFSFIRLATRSYTPFVRRGEDRAKEALPSYVARSLETYLGAPDLETLAESLGLLVLVFGEVGETAGVCRVLETAIAQVRRSLENPG